ncbi:hypothetical protein [Harenicola maris]
MRGWRVIVQGLRWLVLSPRLEAARAANRRAARALDAAIKEVLEQ